MLSINRTRTYKDFSITLNTIQYEYPESLVVVKYTEGSGNKKTFFSKVYYNTKGKLVFKTKKPLSEKSKEYIKEMVWGCLVFISGNNKNITNQQKQTT
jgi:hypothetical protein